MARDAPCPLTPVPPTVGGLMPLFSVTVREHTYTGRFYSDVVQAGSCEEALQAAAERAAVPWPPPGPTPQAEFDVAVTGAPAPGGWIPALCTPGAARTRRNRPPGAARMRRNRPPGAARTCRNRPPGAARMRRACAGTGRRAPRGRAATGRRAPRGRAGTGRRAPRGCAGTGRRAPRGRAGTGRRAPRGGTGNSRRAGCCTPAGAWPSAAARIHRRGAGTGARRRRLHRKRAGRLQRGGAARSRRAGRRASAVAWPRAAGRRRRTAGVWRCLDLLPAALRAGGGTRSSAHGRRTRLQPSGEVGAGRSRRRPYPARSSHPHSRGFPDHAAIAPLRPVSLPGLYRFKPRTQRAEEPALPAAADAGTSDMPT